MKKLLLSLVAFMGLSMTANAQIDLEDPSTYTVTVLDFKDDAELKGQSITLSGTGCGTAWETGNAKYQTIFPVTSPAPMVDKIAMQAVANGGSGKGYWLRDGYGLVMINANRSAAVTNLEEGQVVVFTLSGNFAIDATGGGQNEGTYTREVSADGKTLTYTMTSAGNLGFCISSKSTTNAIQKISIYKEKVAGECPAPTAKVTGAAGVGRVVTLSCPDADAEIFWSEQEEGDYELVSGPVTTQAPVIYAYAESAGVKSEIISFNTGAGSLVKLNGVTITRTADNKVTLVASQLDVIGNPTVSICYTVGEGAETTVAEGASVTVDGDVVAWAVKEGYENSDTTSYVFVAPYEVEQLSWEADFVALGAANTTMNMAAAEALEQKEFEGVPGSYYSAGVDGASDLYLQTVADASGNLAWLYRTGKGDSNFKCQYAAAYMVVSDVNEATVVKVKAGNDNASKNPISGVINGEYGYSYGGYHFFKANGEGALAIQFGTGSMIMNVQKYLNETLTGISNVPTAVNNNVMYNLAGQRVSKANGIVIINGKKVVK